MKPEENWYDHHCVAAFRGVVGTTPELIRGGVADIESIAQAISNTISRRGYTSNDLSRTKAEAIESPMDRTSPEGMLVAAVSQLEPTLIGTNA